jgi:hypothetical protein
LFLLLGGLQLFLSSNLDLGGISVHFGPEGFLSYLLPLLLLLCGLLVWVTPAQRVFYGVIGALTSVYSLIGLNLGGFFLGMLFGVLGSSLAIAWTPVRLERPPASPATESEDGDEGSADQAPTASFDELMTGPLTDTLPPPVNPLTNAGTGALPPHPAPSPSPGPGEAEPEPPAAPTRPAEPTVPHQRPPSPDSEETVGGPPSPGGPSSGGPSSPGGPSSGGLSSPGGPPSPGGPLPRRNPRLFSIALILLATAAMGVVALQGAGAAPAYAEPCEETMTETTEAAPTPSTSTSAAAAPKAGAAEDAEEDQGIVGGIIDGIGDAVGDLLGVAETPSPTPSASPEATTTSEPEPTPTEEDTSPADDCESTPGGSPTASASPTTPVKRIAAAPGQPPVAAQPSRLTGSRVTMSGLSFDGVAELKTAGGDTIRALQFSMDKSVTTDFTLAAPEANGAAVVFRTKTLTVEGNVKFYASRFAGKLCDPIGQLVCVIPLVFTPDSPPPLTLPEMAFGDPDIQLVFVDSDILTGTPSLDMTVES